MTPTHAMLWSDLLPQPVLDFLDTPLGVGTAILAGAIVVWIVARLAAALWMALTPGGAGRKTAAGVPQERLADYPPPPGDPGPMRLTVEGIPARVRLVVVAPVGKERAVHVEDVEALLDKVIFGLRGIVERDRPRIRVWPPQLSKEGFANSFHRTTERPDPAGQPSRWVLLGGQASAQGRPILLALAVLTDEANTLGTLNLSPADWPATLRVQVLTA